MTPTIAVIVRCGDQLRQVVATTRSVETQTLRACDLVLVADPSTPPAAEAWLESLARGRGWRIVRASSLAPAVAWNEGVQASDADAFLCIAAGDELLPSCLAAVAGALTDRASGLVVAATREGGAGAVALPDDLRFPAARVFTKTPNAAGQMFAVSKQAWSDLGGFDRDLPALEDLDFLIRYEAAGRRVAVLPGPVAIRVLRRGGLLERAWTGARPAALEAIARKYAANVEALGDVFYHAQNARTRLRLENQRLLGRRTQAAEELEVLTAKAKQLRWELPPDEQHRVELGDLRRVSPVSRDWGYERGAPVDRHYIEAFLAAHAQDIRGAVLEVQEPDYTERFGADRVTKSDVIDLDSANPRATIISDLRAASNIASETYDCIILTQTLHVIDDMGAVVSECARILKPGGVVLATLPCASRVSVEYGYNGDFWRATEAGARRIFSGSFPADRIETQSLGNVLTTAAFLYGLGGQELTDEDYAAFDPFFPMLVTVRATKADQPARRWNAEAHFERSRPAGSHSGSGILLYHRVATPASDIHYLAVSAADFRQQMAHLKDQYRVVPLSQFAREAGDGSLAPGTVAVTFDDGYLDNLVEASPTLTSLGVPATFFVTTEGSPEAGYWWDEIESILLVNAAFPKVNVSLPDGELELATGTAGERLAAYWTIYRAIVSAPRDTREAALQSLREAGGSPGPAPDARRATPKEILDLASRGGHDIGAHSVSHLMLPAQSHEVQRREVGDCRASLEELLGRPVSMFAYPFGAFDSATRSIVAEAGFAAAVACGDAPVPRTPDPMALPRLDVAARAGAPFDEWLERRLGSPRHQSLRTRSSPDVRSDRPPTGRALVAGWFSYEKSDSTAGDLLASDLVCEWLTEAGLAVDVAVAPPFSGGVDLANADPAKYSHAVFVCGPFMPNTHERAFAERFKSCKLVGVNLSLPIPLADWNPFDVLFERDSDRIFRPDITFAASEARVPVIGVCLVESYDGARTAVANQAIERLLARRHATVVPVDTRLDENLTGLRTKAEVESLLARMDA
ncbi:MAG TPA: polysaccharide deacetylase family protein, partial [Vicinamibacterales bacterium]|nr:polysaccharide deacetylase family protein [Vicinamibacterales bacterium]